MFFYFKYKKTGQSAHICKSRNDLENCKQCWCRLYAWRLSEDNTEKRQQKIERDQKWKLLSGLYWYQWANNMGPARAISARLTCCWIRQIINHFAFAPFIIFVNVNVIYTFIWLKRSETHAHTHTNRTQAKSGNKSTHYTCYAFQWIFLFPRLAVRKLTKSENLSPPKQKLPHRRTISDTVKSACNNFYFVSLFFALDRHDANCNVNGKFNGTE